ncbi:MAG TPA: ATP-binding cassette domain-containing protein [Candidatus Dormibacteraeota bacterium]|jgi:energy-coupling factor transport system ATP-binding protein|nr:ATP-binding cassette domain-containing protein [Candidatus Dormibacteraeota bacterium]
MTETLPRPGPEVLATSPRLAAIASFQDLTYHYADSKVPALAGINVDLEPGLTIVAGDSGSGKSSLLRVLNGLIPHFHGGRIRGDAVVCGSSVLTARTRHLARNVGFVFQDPESQFVYGTVEREVAFGPENLGLPRAEIGARVEEVLAALGITHLRRRAIATLSGGERQRVALASALAMRPAILALDEPTSQLDPSGAAAFLSAILELAAGGASLAVTEHRLSRLLPAADHMVLMNSGAVRANGPPRSLASQLSHPPQVVELGRRLGWRPPALTIAEAMLVAPVLARAPERAPAARGSVIWEVQDLCLRHYDQVVLEGASLAGHAGEVVVLMGDNGSGKTTLLRALAGLHPPAAGSVDRELGERGRVSYLPQDPTALLHHPTVRAELDFTLSRAGFRGTEAQAASDAILGALGLSDLASRYPRDLSGGERQRAAIGAILAGSPKLALLDEPTRGMDGSAREALAALVRQLRAAGSSVVLATHDSELAADLADRVVRLDGGRAVDGGPPEQALASGQPGATDIARLYPGGPVSVEGVMACL